MTGTNLSSIESILVCQSVTGRVVEPGIAVSIFLVFGPWILPLPIINIQVKREYIPGDEIDQFRYKPDTFELLSEVPCRL